MAEKVFDVIETSADGSTQVRRSRGEWSRRMAGGLIPARHFNEGEQ